MDEPRVIIVAADRCTDPGIAAATTALGYGVLPVQTVNEAVITAQREGARVAAILSGVALRDGNWCDLVERLGSLGCEAPVVLCSSEGSAETWWDALEHGVWDVVSTPITAHALERILKEMQQKKGIEE